MFYELDGIKPQTQGDGIFVAPSADVIGNVSLAAQCSVWFNVTIRGDNDPISIGERSNVQDNSVLHADPGVPLEIGSNVTVGHKVMLHGCKIGDNTLIGMGSTILNGARIGKNSIVGAGSLITEGKEFPDGVLIVGAPAKVVRELSPDQMKMIEMSADIYVENGRRFTKGMKQITFD